LKVSRLSFSKQLTLNVLWFSLNAQDAALLPLVIPAQLLLFVASGQVGSAQQATFLSWLVLGASIVSLFLPIVIGSLSDRTPGVFGRRRPYIALGGFLLVISTPLLVEANNNMLLFLIGLSVLLVGKNILTPAYQSLVPDCVPKEQRGKASGYVGGMTILGSVASLGLAALLMSGINQQTYSKSVISNSASLYYIVTAVLMIIGVLVTVIGVREVPFMHLSRPSCQAGEKTLLKFSRWFVHNWVEPWRKFNFTVVFLTRSCIMLGLALFMTFIEYYFARVQHITNFVQVTAIVAVLALTGAVVSGFVSGLLSDRLKRRAPLICVATLCMSLASLAFVVFPSSLALWLWPLGILFGLGQGAYMSVDWALSIDSLPSLEAVGKDLGLWNASTTLPAIIAPLLGSFIINITDKYGQAVLGYRMVFSAATVFLVIAAVGILFVREHDNHRNASSSAKVEEG